MIVGIDWMHSDKMVELQTNRIDIITEEYIKCF